MFHSQRYEDPFLCQTIQRFPTYFLQNISQKDNAKIAVHGFDAEFRLQRGLKDLVDILPFSLGVLVEGEVGRETGSMCQQMPDSDLLTLVSCKSGIKAA